MLLESLTIVTSPRTDPNTFLLQDHISASASYYLKSPIYITVQVKEIKYSKAVQGVFMSLIQ